MESTTGPAEPAPSPDALPLETPDPQGAFPRLDTVQIGVFRRYGERRPLRKDDVLAVQGEPSPAFFVVLEGAVAVLDARGTPKERLPGSSGLGASSASSV